MPRTVEVALEPGDTNVYIFTYGGKMTFVVDKRTIRKKGCALSLLTYKRVNRIVVKPVKGEVDTPKCWNDSFMYKPRIAC